MAELLSLTDDFESIPNLQNGRNEQHRMMVNRVPETNVKFGVNPPPQNSWSRIKEKMRQNNSHPINREEIEGRPKQLSVKLTNLRFDDYGLSADAEIGSNIILATIDTGATSNYVSEDVAETVFGNHPKTPTEIEVVLADGSTNLIRNTIECQVQIGQTSKNVSFLIMPDAIEEMIIGLNLLRIFKTTISFGSLSLCMEERSPHRLRTCMVIQDPKGVDLIKPSTTLNSTKMPSVPKLISPFEVLPKLTVQRNITRKKSSKCLWLERKIESVCLFVRTHKIILIFLL